MQRSSSHNVCPFKCLNFCKQVPGGAAGYYLLGKLYTLTDNPAMATSAFSAALMRDPLMWCAYEGLCRLGKARYEVQVYVLQTGFNFLGFFDTSSPWDIQIKIAMREVGGSGLRHSSGTTPACA